MAPLRSSRSNRHLQQDTGPQGRLRGGVVDHDPMEGLPVRRWEMMDVTIKQDAKDEDNDEDGKQGSNPNWPWPDLPFPKDFHLLPPHSQELLRRARAPNKSPNVAVFNKELGEYQRPNLNPNNPAAMTPVSKVPNFKDNFSFPSAPTPNLAQSTTKDADHDAAADHEDDLEPDKPPPEETHERTISLKRWVPLPQPIADKKPEPKYLADRRPGLPPLYGHQAATNTNSVNTVGYAPNISSTLLPNSNPNSTTGDVVVGSVTVPADRAANASGYRVAADGTTVPIGPGIAGGSGTGVSVAAAGQIQVEVRRRPPPPPPKRKKKGGPGRSKKRVDIKAPVVQGQESTPGVGVALERGSTQGGGAAETGATTTTQTTGGAQPLNEAQSQPQPQPQPQSGDAKAAKPDIDTEEAEAGAGAGAANHEIDDGSSTSASSSGEDEGSEEGEIDEGNHVDTPPAPAGAPSPHATSAAAATTTTPASNAAPEPTLQPETSTSDSKHEDQASSAPAPAPAPALPASATTPPTAAPTAALPPNTTTADPTTTTTTTTAESEPPISITVDTTPIAIAAAIPVAVPVLVSVSIQPPSPDLLGNLESEIQGMEGIEGIEVEGDAGADVGRKEDGDGDGAGAGEV